ncbi:hypothetical protein CDL15_Pgr003579 [Punica granatum]|uniref:Late embryogenesis abundant protein LEA-2 subgroup domain-containing protein n=1 Tax=Punica granatum TaxID=22663 RepID=A0A218XT04_PUNGR|nr:hypothetical protein CDL15_Pgr003579 [Punica granatum]
MVQGEQVRPLAPASDQPQSDGFEPDVHLKESRNQRCLKCCGCIAAVLLIQVVVIIGLIFTVFQVKDPTIKMNRVTVARLDLVNDSIPKPGQHDHDAVLPWDGGREAHGLPGRARPRRTMRMNTTVDIIPDTLMLSPNLSSGLLLTSSYLRIPRRMKMLNIIKKHVIMKMRRAMVVNISSQAIQEQKCKRRVNLEQ